MNSALMAAAYQAEQDKLRQQPEQENNLVDALGKAALAAGVATAGILGGRRFFAGRGAAPTSVRNTSATTDLSNININNIRRASGRPPVNVTETVVPSRPAPRPAPQTTVERLGDVNEITRQARSERPQGIKFVDQLGEEPPINTSQIIVPKITTKETPTGQSFGLSYLNSLLGRKPAVEEVTRQARNERSQGIPFLDLSDEVRTSVDPWSGKETILTPFGSPTVPSVRTTETTTRGTRLLSPATPDITDRLLNDPDLLKRVEAEELAKENLLSSNRSEQAKQAARRRQVLTATGDDIISSLRLEANQLPSVSERLRSVGAGLSGVPEELGGDGIKIYSAKFNRDLDFSSPITQQLLTSANVTQNEAINYWTQKITSFTTEAAQSDFGPQTFLKQKGYIDAESMTEQHVAARPQHIEQVEDALSSGTYQMEGRTKHRLQQNEDLDLGQVEIMEEMADAQYRNFVNQEDPSQMMGLEPDIHVEQVASRLPDGLPVDQAEGFKRDLSNTPAMRFLEKERDEISRILQNEGLPVSPSRIEKELANRLSGSTASSYGPKYTARKQALELYAQTGDPQFLEKIEKYGLKPVTFDPDSEDIISLVSSKNIVNMPGLGEVSTASLRRPVITESTARQADEFIKRRTEEKLNANPWLENIKSEVEEAKQQIYSERKQLAEQTGKALKLQLEQAKERGQVNTVRQLENQLGALRNIYRNPELGQHREFGEGGIRQLDARLRGAQETNLQQIQELEKKYPTTLVNNSGEVNRLFGILDDEGEFIPESMEFRSERPMIDTKNKSGGGRNIAEYASGSRNITLDAIREVQQGGRRTKIRDYDIETGGAPQVFEDDRSGSGRVIDRYGIRLAGEQGADVTLRPSQPVYSENEIMEEAYNVAQKNAYDQAPTRVPTYEEAIESLGRQPATEAGRRSILASEAARLGKTIYPSSMTGPYPSSLLTSKPKPLPKLNNTQSLPSNQNTQPSFYRNEDTQLSFPAYIVPATQLAAKVRMTPADQATEQLNAYMSKLQRGRTSPLTSEVRIQPSLF